MDSWSIYSARSKAHGLNMHDAMHKRESRYITNKVRNNLSYFNVTIDCCEQEVAIVDSDNLNEKKIFSMPGEHIRHGGLVDWMDNYWLIVEKDANSNIYERGKLLQCNHLLKWVSSDGVIHEQWCVVEDGTKYLTGEYEDRNFVVTRGDTRLSVTIAVNEDTAKMGRELRVLIDHPLADPMLAYTLSKPLRVGTRYDDCNGVFKFVLQEATTTDNDNQELGIADYYKYFSRSEDEETDDPLLPPAEDEGTKRKVYI